MKKELLTPLPNIKPFFDKAIAAGFSVAIPHDPPFMVLISLVRRDDRSFVIHLLEPAIN